MSGPDEEAGDKAEREPGGSLAPKATGGEGQEAAPESLADVLASIRALVSAETHARVEGRPAPDVILLTPDMRLDGDGPAGPAGAGAQLAEGLDAPAVQPESAPAPILDEESLRATINAIVREELQGELGERIGRNLRKLIRREIAQMLEEARKP